MQFKQMFVTAACVLFLLDIHTLQILLALSDKHSDTKINRIAKKK